MPPKRKAGTTAKAKRHEPETEIFNAVEEKISSEELMDVEEESKKKASKRGNRNAHVVADEPQEKVTKVDKKTKEKKGKLVKKDSEDNEDMDEVVEKVEPTKRGKGRKKEAVIEDIAEQVEDNEEMDEVVEKVEPIRRGKGRKKEAEVEDITEQVEDNGEMDVVVEKVEPTRKGKGRKKEPEVEENGEHVENDVKVETAKRGRSKRKEEVIEDDEPAEITEKKGKADKKAAKNDKAKAGKKPANAKDDKKEPKSKSTRKGKDHPEKNGKDEEFDEEKPAKIPMNSTSTHWDKINFKCTRKNAKDETYNLKISCWNVGGLKSWVKKDCLKFLEYENPDIMCLQETKCSEEKLPDEIRDIADYKQYWCSSNKEGYAGVGLLSKKEPISIAYGINEADQDIDGRCLTAEYENYYVVCVYVPNAGRKLVTLPKRLEWNKAFMSYVNGLDRKKPVIICGDMNVSHNEIDLARPKTNTKNAGFTQEERDGMSEFLNAGYIDTFRELYPDKADMYTFWTYMSNARSKNVGWRLDYFITSERLKKNICDNVIRSEVLGSDHCPITLFINI